MVTVRVPDFCAEYESGCDGHPVPDGDLGHPVSFPVSEPLDGLEGVAATSVVDVADGAAVEVGEPDAVPVLGH